MIDLQSFINIFPKSFSKKLRESVIPYKSAIIRSDIAKELHGEIAQFIYHPSPPRDYIIMDKGNSVARIVPSFIAKDYFLYYFCTKILEDELAVNYVSGTYGGWRLGNQIRFKEEDSRLILEDYAPANSFDPFLWAEHWGDYQRKAYEVSKSGNYQWVVKIDIANFYDNINIELLGKMIYLISPARKRTYIDLLIHFLKNWNKKLEGYAQKMVGLPQDELSDSSRLLANFYLQEYDKEIKQICIISSAEYLRYADDQLFYTQSLADAKHLVYKASILLSKIGLNINTGKVHYFRSMHEFNEYWAFELFELLGDTHNKSKINSALRRFIDLKDRQILFREYSVLKRIINQDFSLFEPSLKHKILSFLLDQDFVSRMDSWLMDKIYLKLDTSDKKDFLQIVDALVDEIDFNHFHYNLAIFYKKNKINYDVKRLSTRISYLKI